MGVRWWREMTKTLVNCAPGWATQIWRMEREQRRTMCPGHPHLGTRERMGEIGKKWEGGEGENGGERDEQRQSSW